MMEHRNQYYCAVEGKRSQCTKKLTQTRNLLNLNVIR